MTPMAALLLQWVIRVSPDFILFEPILAILWTAFSDSSANLLPSAMTASRAASKDSASFRPRTVACTPFHSDTAVGRESSSVSEAFLMSDLNCSRSLTVYASA